MNSAHWHLLLNHLPITGAIFGTALLASGFFLKNINLKNTGLVLFIFTALIAIPVLLTGEGAEEILEAIGEDNHDLIHDHEDVSENAFWLSAGIGLISLFAFIASLREKKQARILMIIVLCLGVINSMAMTYAAVTGGQIRHTEIRPVN